MSPDEIMVFIGALALGGWYWGSWLTACFTVEDFGRAQKLHALAIVVPLLALAQLLVVLKTQASYDVREDWIYLAFYTVFGATWLAGIVAATGLFGLSFRDDWLERRNPAAAMTGVGVLFGGTATFAGGNIGDGPGWWVVLWSVLLASSGWFLAWWLYARLSGAMEHITVDRDLGAGIRFAGLLIAVGIVLGRAVAGNWVGIEATFNDFTAIAWPVLPYCIGLGCLEGHLAKTRRVSSLPVSCAWAAVHLGAAGISCYFSGPIA